MSTENEIEVNELDLFNSLVDSSWDSIEDLPEFVVPAVGDYMVRINKAELGQSKDKTEGVIRILGQIEEVIELANEGDTPPVIGSLVSVQYQGKIGISRFKKTFGDVAQAISANNPKELIDMLPNNVLAVTFKQRADKEKIDPNTNKPVVYPEWATVVHAS